MYAPNAVIPLILAKNLDMDPCEVCDHLHAEQVEVIVFIKLELEAVFVGQLRQDVILNISQRVPRQGYTAAYRSPADLPSGEPSEALLGTDHYQAGSFRIAWLRDL